MEKLSRKEEFLDVAMRIAAESGLNNFSMKKVTDKVGVSEALIYKYFPTKEILLYSCFESVHKRIAALYNGIQMPKLSTATDVYEFVHLLWIRYFTFLVSNSYKTIFYFDYRDSTYIRQIMAHDDEAAETFFKDFAVLMHAFNEHFHFTQKSDSSVLWTYILDTSGLFAKRIIRGEIVNSSECYGHIWRMLSGGILGLLHSES